MSLARPPGKVLWDTTLVICSLQNTGKRARLGNQAMLPKDTFRKFLLTIKVSTTVIDNVTNDKMSFRVRCFLKNK